MFFSGASHWHHRLLARLPSIPRRRRGGGGGMWREQRRRPGRLYSPSLFPQPCSHHGCDPGMSILKNDENWIKLPDRPFQVSLDLLSPRTSSPTQPFPTLSPSLVEEEEEEEKYTFERRKRRGGRRCNHSMRQFPTFRSYFS